MSIITPSASVKTDLLTAIKTAIDSGGAAGRILFYTGTKPAGPDTAVTTQVLLGTLTLAYPCGTISGSSLTFDTITQDPSADASGVVTWARLLNSAGVAKFDFDVTGVGGTGFIQMNTVSIVALGPINLSAMVLSV